MVLCEFVVLYHEKDCCKHAAVLFTELSEINEAL